jgi:CheY-like chemotaxis protein
VSQKTILLVDDEQWFLEALADALEHEGHRVLKARSVSQALELLGSEPVDLITIDIMLDPGAAHEAQVGSQDAGLFLCREVRRKFPTMAALSISVVSDMQTIRTIEAMRIKFVRKGETPLNTVLRIINSKLVGTTF